MNMIVCPGCKGKGKSFCHINTGLDSSMHEWGDVQCHRCKGAGNVPAEMTKWIEQGAEIKKQRVLSRVSLYQKSLQLGISSAELSSIESGKVDNTAYYEGVTQ